MNGPAAVRGAPRGTGRDELIRAVIRVVAALGLRGLTYRAVAQEAGVAHALVAHHFGSLHALLGEALRYSVHESLAASTLEPPTSELESFVAELPATIAALADLHAFQYELVLAARRDPVLQAAVRRYHEEYRAAIGRQLRALGVHDEALTDLVWASLDGIVFQQVVIGDQRSSERALDSLRAVIAAQRP